MKVLVTYDMSTMDAAGRARLRKVAKACKSFGVRVQYSIFECSVGQREWLLLRDAILRIIDLDSDSVRFYFIGEDEAKKTEHHGVRPPVEPDGPLFV